MIYRDDLVTIYHGDAQTLDAWTTADVLVTDPPYGRAWKQGHLKAGPGRRRAEPERRHGIAGDADTDVRDTILAMWGPDRRAAVFGDLMLPPPAGVKQVLIYRKPPNAGVRGATAGRRRDLEAVYLVGPWESGIGGSTSLIETSEPSQGNPSSPQGRYGHPHAKPVDVMIELIDLVGPGVVADPFAGSGSTLVAAKRCGRRCIAVEIDERHARMCARRSGQLTIDYPA